MVAILNAGSVVRLQRHEFSSLGNVRRLPIPLSYNVERSSLRVDCVSRGMIKLNALA